MSLDFIVKLLKYCRRNQAFQYILVIVNKLTEQHLYELLKTLKTTKFINVIYRKIFATYRFLLTTVNNKGN